MSDDSYIWLKNTPFLDSETGREIARRICEKYDFSLDDFFSLVKAKIEGYPTGQQLFLDFDDIFGRESDDVD